MWFGLLNRAGTWVLAALASMVVSSAVHASPFVDSDDWHLRAAIQQLADGGHLRGNVTSYPLLWAGIARDLRDLDVRWLNEDELFAYHRVRAALEFAQRSSINGVKLAGSSSNAVGAYEHGSLRVSRSFTGQYTAARLQTTVRADVFEPDLQAGAFGVSGGHDFVFDGSYLATTVGNWALSIDQLDAWWGPGRDNALVLSDNSRAIQALRVNRLTDDPLPLWGAGWLGHVQATAFVGRSQNSATLGDEPVVGVRVNARPWNRGGRLGDLQVGASYFSYWQDFSQRYNQLAGLDVRMALGFGAAWYAEVASHTRGFDSPALTIGMDYHLGNANNLRLLFVEFTRVPENFYQQWPTEPAGYRRWGLNIGAAQDQDVRSLAMGYRAQHARGQGWNAVLRYSDHGDTSWLPSHPAFGAEFERVAADIEYQMPVGDNALLKFGTALYVDDISDTFGPDLETGSAVGSTEFNVEIRVSIERRF